MRSRPDHPTAACSNGAGPLRPHRDACLDQVVYRHFRPTVWDVRIASLRAERRPWLHVTLPFRRQQIGISIGAQTHGYRLETTPAPPQPSAAAGAQHNRVNDWMHIAILGWGSLLWETETDRGREFDTHHKPWLSDGPRLRLEFSRISESRNRALTLVLDYKNGVPCQVKYAFSRRRTWEDTVCDLRCREGTTLANIGCYFPMTMGEQQWRNANTDAKKSIHEWTRANGIDVVVWTALKSNFEALKQEEFSVDAAKRHVRSLDALGEAKAAEYFWRAPNSVVTPLRQVLQSEPWFRKPFTE